MPASEKNKPEWDVIVIGTGMGGAASGAICAKHGLKTLILEKNPRPGGSCSYYEKMGFHIDTGTHLFLRGNKGPFGVCTQRLGMGYPIEFRRPPLTCQFKGMNLDITFPRSLARIAMVLPRAAWQLRIPPREYPNILRLFADIIQMKPEKIDALNTVPIEDFILSYTNNNQVRSLLDLLMGLFFILPTWESSAGESVWCMQKLFLENNLSYPKGGAVAISKAILAGARKYGAHIRMSAGVKKIDISKGRVKGVVLKNGKRMTTRAVISTTALKDTILDLAGPEFFPAPYVEKIQAIKGSMIAVQAKIGVKKRLIKAGVLVGVIPLKLDHGKLEDTILGLSHKSMEQGRVSKYIPFYAPIPTNYDSTLAPKGCQIITACAGAPTLDIDLVDKPRKWIDGLMSALYQIIPDLEENILFCDTWSVKKTAAWIGKKNGSAVTTGQTIDQVGANRPLHETPVRGLYAAGDCAGPARGVGTELACQSGMDCADLIIKDFAHMLI